MTRASLLLLLLACGGPPPAHPARAPQPAPPRPPPPSRRALPGYPPPVEPARSTCLLTGPWGPDQPHELRFRRGGRTFATIHQVERAALSLGDDPASPFVELRSRQARLWGVVVADQLLIHPTRPLLLAGYLAPGPTAVLRWLGATSEPAPITLVVPDFLAPAAPPKDEVSCGDLGLATAEFDPREAIEAPAGTDMVLVDGRPIPLSREPSGPPVAQLDTKTGSPMIEVIERRGDRARIVAHDSSLNPAENVLVVGWVAASAVTKRPSGFGGSWGSAGDGTSALPRRRDDLHMVTCPREIPLVVELEGERHLVGAVASGVRLEVPADLGKAGRRLVEIVVRSRQVEFADEVRVFAQGDALADCSPALAPEP